MLPKYFDIQSLRIAKTEEEFRENIHKFKNVFVTCMLRYKEHYISVRSLGTNWKKLVTSTTWNIKKSNSNGVEGKFIVGLYKFDKRWESHYALNTGVIDQNINVLENWPDLKDFIRDQWRKGYDVTDLVSDEGSYYVVSSLGLNLNQSWVMSKQYPQEDAVKAYEKGRILTEVAPVNDSYLWIFSGNTGFSDQHIEYNPDTEKIQSIVKQLMSDEKYDGFSLSLVREINGKLLFIFVK